MAKITIPDEVFGKKLGEDLIEKVLSKKDPQPTNTNISNQPNIENYIYVPSINLYISKEKTLHNNDWNDAHKKLKEQGLRMPTIPEFLEFLRYIKSNPNDQEYASILKEITELKSPWRSEWLDAYFEQENNQFYIYTKNKTIKQPLESCLMEDKTPGIDFNNLLDNPTKQGLPKANVREGNLYYWHPRNGTVARFDADSGWGWPQLRWVSAELEFCARGTFSARSA